MPHRLPRRLLLAGLAVAAAALLAPHVRAEDEAPEPPHVKAEINAQGLAALLGARTPLVLLDARGPQPEFIPTARPCTPNMPADEVARLAPSKAALVVTYCGGPSCAASQDLADRLARDGYKNVIRYTGGVEAWTQAGFKLQQAAPPPQKPQPAPPRGSGSRGSGGR